VRRSRKLACAAIVCVLASAGPALTQDGPGEPFELVRSLQSLQDQITRGNARAHANQGVLLRRIAEQFDAADSESWKNPKNARAAVLFVLNGGNVRALQKVIGGGKSDLDEKLLKGVLAFGEKRPDQALELLGGIDARTLDPSLAGHIAYIQGDLALKEPAKAQAYFDDARLLAPGTILEEASLRRQIALYATAGNIDRYEMLATQYLRRFPNSIYAGNFRHQFALALAASTHANDAARLERVAILLGGVRPAERREVYLTIAREALVKGKMELARFAATNALQLTTDDGAEKERARLYEGAALIVTQEFDKGVETLSAVERSKLGGSEVALLDAALSVAGQMRRLPDEPEADSEPPAGVETIGAAATLERARRAITQVDEMLSGPTK
jgi:chemotaxis protein MotC